jgi:hypothetical protein
MRNKLKKAVLEFFETGPLLSGSISEQYNVCGTPNCRCKDKVNPRKHGPQKRLSYTHGGRNSTMVVKKADAAHAAIMTANLLRLRQVQSDILGETLRIYKESDAATAYKEMETAILHAKAEFAGTAFNAEKHRQLEESRDRWKAKAKAHNADLRKDVVKVRDLTISRDRWKEKYTSLKRDDEERITELARLKREKAERDGLISTLEAQAKKGRPTTS